MKTEASAAAVQNLTAGSVPSTVKEHSAATKHQRVSSASASQAERTAP